MKDNPFITTFLLICIEIGVLYYLTYTNSLLFKKEGVFMGIFFSVPIISLGISLILENNRYQKSFRRFSIFLIIVATIAFAIISYLGALGRAYQH